MCKYFGNQGLDLVLNHWGFFFSGILDSCCLDAKKIFKTEINVPICAQWGFWRPYVQFFWKLRFRYGAKSIGFYEDFFFFFFWGGFWILAVWMPRKYSRLKLMYFLMNETNSKLLEMKADLSLASFNVWDGKERDGMDEGGEEEREEIWRLDGWRREWIRILRERVLL